MVEVALHPAICRPLCSLQELLEWEPLTCRTPLELRSPECVPGAALLSGDRPLPRVRADTVPRTLVCHDMKGGYLDDKFVHGNDNPDAYQFFQWSGVDLFVYFSHKFVTIPPPGWIHAAHLHGVKILGTVITEWDDGWRLWSQVLGNEEKTKGLISQLTRLAAHYGFDGWLFNVENYLGAKPAKPNEEPKEETIAEPEVNPAEPGLEPEAPKEPDVIPGTETGEEAQVEPPTLEAETTIQPELGATTTVEPKGENEAVAQERKQLAELLRQVVSSLTHSMHRSDPNSEVLWYDAVTSEGHLKWQNSLSMLNRQFFDACDGIFVNYTWTPELLDATSKMAADRRHDVFIGVDVFGRNCFGGGGLNTHLALEVIRQRGLSAAIFAPGWTHETHDPGVAVDVDQRLWEAMAPYLYFHGPTRLPFLTSFTLGSDHRKRWHDLRKQGYQASFLFGNVAIDRDMAAAGGTSLSVTRDTTLMTCSFALSTHVIVSVAFNRDDPQWDLVLWITSREQGDRKVVLGHESAMESNEVGLLSQRMPHDVQVPDSLEDGWYLRHFEVVPEDMDPDSGERVVEVGVALQGEELLHLGWLSFVPVSADAPLPPPPAYI